MKRAAARLWIKALESGKYKQTRGNLRDADGSMCCLGVLCHISKQSAWTRLDFGDNRRAYGRGEDRDGLLLPESVQKWAGLKYPNPQFPCENGKVFASVLNDDRNFTFKQIAALVRKHWREL